MVQVSFKLFAVAFIGIMLCPNDSSGLGINCRGSSSCSGIYNLNIIVDKVCNQTPQGNVYNPGVRIATNCVASSGIAAFIQSTSQSLNAGQVCQLLRKLQDHGCRVCGSIPINPGNDVSKGQVTVNFVSACG